MVSSFFVSCDCTGASVIVSFAAYFARFNADVYVSPYITCAMYICLEATVSRGCVYVPFRLHCEGETIKQRHLSSKDTLETMKHSGFHTKALLSSGWFAEGLVSGTARSCRAHPKPR